MSETIYEAHILITPFLELRKLRLNDHCKVVAFNLGCKLASLEGIFFKEHHAALRELNWFRTTALNIGCLGLPSPRELFGNVKRYFWFYSCNIGTSRVESLFLNGQKRQCSLVTTETHPASNVNRSRVNPRCARGNGRHQGNCLLVTEGSFKSY